MKKETQSNRGRRPAYQNEELNRYLDGIFTKIRQQYHKLADISTNPKHYKEYTVAGIADKISTKYGEDIVGYDTLRNLLNNTAKTTNIQIIYTLCDVLDINIEDVVDPKVTELYQSTKAVKLPERAQFEELSDDKYTGTFHGYFYNTNKYSNDIMHFTLTIEDSSATLESHTVVISPDGSRKTGHHEFTGVPILSKLTNTITMYLCDARGQSRYIAFDYNFYNHQRLYYRRGIMVSTEGNSKKPMVQTILILASKLLPEDEALILPGLLKIDQEHLLIPQEIIPELKKDPLINQFLSDYERYMDYNTYLYIKPRLLIESIEINSSDATNKKIALKKALAIINSHSVTPSRILCETATHETQMIKQFLVSANTNTNLKRSNDLRDFLRTYNMTKDELIELLQNHQPKE